MKQKIFNLSDEEIEIIKKVREENKLKSDAAALRLIIKSYCEFQDQEALIAKSIETYLEEKKEFTERLRWSTTTAEQNSIMILDAVNTILEKYGIYDCVPVDVYETPVIRDSKKKMKDKIAYFKQKKDERRSKEK